MNLLVVGAGAMGRWLADTVDADVAFLDRDADAAARATAAVGGRVVTVESNKSLESTESVSPIEADESDGFDAVCFAVPMSAVNDAIEAYASLAEQAVFDVTGVMAAPIESMREHAPDCERVSFHPLFAPRNAPGNVAVVVDNPGSVTDEIRQQLAAADNHVFETTVEEHDDAMETVQAGAHTAVLAYALAAADVREEFATPISDGLDGLVGTVTDGTPRVYAEIQSVFDGADDVADAAARIADADADEFETLYHDIAVRYNSASDVENDEDTQ